VVPGIRWGTGHVISALTFLQALLIWANDFLVVDLSLQPADDAHGGSRTSAPFSSCKTHTIEMSLMTASAACAFRATLISTYFVAVRNATRCRSASSPVEAALDCDQARRAHVHSDAQNSSNRSDRWPYHLDSSLEGTTSSHHS
jgi:hypothetical protein